jgi:hypothetical protein
MKINPVNPFLSESGCTGFEDVQDEFLIFIYISEIAFCLNQDVQDLRIYRMFIKINLHLQELR